MSKYTDKERDGLCKKHYISKTKTVNLMPYKFELRDYGDEKSVSVNEVLDGVELDDGTWLDQFHVTHWPTFKELYLAVEDFLSKKEEHGLTLDDIKLSTESHYLEGWDDGPFDEIKVTVQMPLAIKEIESEIDKQLDQKHKWEEQKAKQARKKEADEKKLLEELKSKYE